MKDNKLEIQDIYSLSPMQEGMLFHTLLNKKSTSFFQQMVLSIEGQLDLAILNRGINILIERYAIFRTIFIYEKLQRPKQVVIKKRVTDIYYEDLSNTEHISIQKRIREYADDDKAKGFDLSKDILLRLAVFKKDTDTYDIIISFHHIVTDGWCFAIILKELFQIYRALKENEDLPSNNILPYSNYIKWLEKQDKAKAYDFWNEYLNEYESDTIVPRNNTAKAFEYDLRTHSFNVDEEIVSSLNKLAIGYKVSLNTIIQCVWGIILQKYNGTKDAVFGVVVSGRSIELEGIDNMVGLFINTIPVRIRTTQNQQFEELVKETQEKLLSAENFSYCQLAEIQAKSPLKNNLINNLMIFENYPIDKELQDLNILKNMGFTITNIEMFEQTNYDFNIKFMQSKDLTVNIDYNAFVFDSYFIRKIEEHFKEVLKQIIKEKDIKVEGLNLLTNKEREKLLNDFNNTAVDYEKNKTIHSLIEEQSIKNPDNIAVIYKDIQLTYKELNKRANVLANYIIGEYDVKPDTLIGVYINRSHYMIIAILAVLKAGAAYVPIDSNLPDARVKSIIKDSNIKFLLSDNELTDSLNNLNTVCDDLDSYCCISDELLTMLESNYSNVCTVSNVNSGNLAYVIYTSGSTGEPKGVMIEHKAFINFAKGISDKIELSVGKSILALTTISFDIFALETILPLIKGLRVIVADEEQQSNPKLLRELIVRSNIDIIQLTPTRMQLLLEHEDYVDCLEGLEQIVIGGDVFPSTLLKNLKSLTKAKIFNVYGPTETTVWSTLKELTDSENLNIGKPIANTQIFILDDKGDLVPIGVSGELCIAGDGLARGYHNKPLLTSEKFIDNPFKAGTRLYKTGDRARWLQNGELEYIGRMDYQVKIRGYRIELGEIEEKLNQYEGVKASVVVDKADNKGIKYLCAYIVSDKFIDMQKLRDHLSSFLPNYMIPSLFMIIDKIPLTNSGKINRRLLPEADALVNEHTDNTEPENELEIILHKMWHEILGRDNIGTYSNFFEIGGHSLKATILASKIHKELDVEIPLKDIFANPTIKLLSEYISRAKRNTYVPIKRLDYINHYSMSPSQKRLYILNQFESNNISYNMPFVMTINGHLDKAKFENVLNKLINRHEILRTGFEIKDGEPIQRVYEEVKLPIEFMRIDVEQIESAVNSFIKPFDLSKAPLVRAALAQIKSDMHIFMFDIHHIIADAASVNILIKEIIDLYQGKALKDIKVHYKDFTAWQNEFLKTDIIRQQEKYWLEIFRGQIPVLNMPTDYQRPPLQSFEGDRIHFEADNILAYKIDKLKARTGTTLYMILMAAFNLLLSKYSGQEDIIVATPITSRTHADTENMIGMFVNTLAIRNYPESSKSFISFLDEVKSNTLNSFENKDYQFEELVEQLKIKKDLSRNPLFDVMLVVQNIDMPNLSTDELEFVPHNFKHSMSRFDITLSAMPVEDKILFGLEYSTKLYKKETINRMAEHFINILRAITSKQDSALGSIDILSDNERHKLLVGFNKTDVKYNTDTTLHYLIEQQAKAVPDNIALVFDGQTMTYSQLNKKSNQLARILRKKGVAPNSIVAVLADSSFEMIIGCVAVLKAGGGYLPLVSDYPVDRIRYILEDSSTKIVLTQHRLSSLIQFSGEVIIMDNEEIYTGEAANLDNQNASDDLAYVIYTSGSTGKPKGVMVEHKSIINQIMGQKDNYNVNDSFQHILMAKFSFDVSVQHIFLPLTTGGQLHILKSEVKSDPERFLNYLRKYNFEIFNTVPAYINTLTDNYKINEKLSFKYIILGGDVFTKHLYNKIKSTFNVHKVINIYGPTEATINTTAFECTDSSRDTNLPIGRPLQNYKIFILDRNNKLTPVGVPGELCISGIGVARGYLNMPQLTKEKFIDNPYLPGQKLYRTGDLAKWLPDGNVEFVGRVDYQVKIRNFRVELSEIEEALIKYKEIKDAVVLAKENEDGDKYLVGYYVSDVQISVSKIREYLSKSLPDYMIPGAFIHMTDFPETTNGKIDRNSLPEPIENRPVLEEAYIAPSTEVEKVLVDVWRDVLKAPMVGINDNFFELGGNSLLLVTMHSKIDDKYPGKLTVADIFAYPTISKLAQFIDSDNVKALEQKELKAIRLSDDYFMGQGEECDQYEVFRVEINNSTSKKIMQLAEQHHVGAKEILLSSYIYLLSELSQQDCVEIQAVSDNNNLVSFISIDFNTVTDFTNLFELVNNQLNDKNNAYAYDINKLLNTTVNNNNNGIIPIFAYNCSFASNITDIFDLSMLVNVYAYSIKLTYEYNSKKMNKSKIKELIYAFSKVIDAIVSKELGGTDKHE